MECQTEYDSDAINRLNEDLRKHEEEIMSQKQLFEDELQELKMKDMLSTEEVMLVL